MRHRSTTEARGHRLLAAPLAVALLLAGNGGDGDTSDPGAGQATSEPGDGSAAEPARGGTFTYFLPAVSARHDPAFQKIYSFSPAPVMGAIFGQLMYAEPGSQDIQMGFLESFQPSDGGTTWTATLRPDLTFSDGTDFDAEAIAYNIRRAADPEIGSTLQDVASQMELEVVDATTLRITLPEPNLQYAYIFLESFSTIGSPTAMEEMGDDFATAPVGAGPFKFEEFVEGQSLTLVRNEHYESYMPGQPYLDEVVFQQLPDFPRQAAALANGEGDMAWFSGAQGLEVMTESGVDIQSWETGGGGTFLFNTSIPPFDNPDARKAVSLALDRTAVANSFNAGSAPATNLFPETSPYYDPANDWETQDREEAQRLFDKIAAEDEPLSFTLKYFATFPDSVNTANLIQSTLQTFDNVSVELEGRQTPDAQADQRSGNFEMIAEGLYLEFAVPDASEYFRTGGSLNYSQWSNAAVDDAIAAIYQSDDEDFIKTQWDIVLAEFNAENPVYFAQKPILGIATSPEITGLTPTAHGFVPLWGEIGFREG